MTDIESECRAAWFKAEALEAFAEMLARKITRDIYLEEYGVDLDPTYLKEYGIDADL